MKCSQIFYRASQVAQWQRIRLPMQETQEMWVWSLGQEDPLEEKMGNPLWYSCWENSMDRGAWLATIHGITKSQKWLNDWAHTRVFYHWLTSPKTVWIESAKWLCHDSSWRVFHFIKYFGITFDIHETPKLHITWDFKDRGFPDGSVWRICQPMQETWVRSLVQKDSTCCGAAEPVHQNYWACALEPRNHSYWAHMLQLLKPAVSRAHTLWQEKLL